MLSQKQLASIIEREMLSKKLIMTLEDQARQVGKSRQYLDNIRNGKVDIRISLLKNLCKLYKHDFFFDMSNPKTLKKYVLENPEKFGLEKIAEIEELQNENKRLKKEVRHLDSIITKYERANNYEKQLTEINDKVGKK